MAKGSMSPLRCTRSGTGSSTQNLLSKNVFLPLPHLIFCLFPYFSSFFSFSSPIPLFLFFVFLFFLHLCFFYFFFVFSSSSSPSYSSYIMSYSSTALQLLSDNTSDGQNSFPENTFLF